MAIRQLIAALTTVAITILSSGCGGDGNLAFESNQLPSGRVAGPLTPLPAFLVNNTTRCAFEENGKMVSLVQYRGNLDDVTLLTCESASFDNLEGIEALTILETLDIPNSGLAALTELAGNSTITKLYLDDNPLVDITALNSMTGVVELHINDTGISDLAPLQDMSRLRVLLSANNPLADTDLTPLSSLNLRRLDISNTGISDINSLSNMEILKRADLSDNQIEDISALTDLDKLERIDLSNNLIEDVSPLVGKTTLLAVYLHRNDNIDCFSLQELEASLRPNVVKTKPAECDNSYILTWGTRPIENTLDNSTLELPYGRIFVRGSFGIDDIIIEKSGNDLTTWLILNRWSYRNVTFTNWYLGEEYQVPVFRLPDKTEYTYEEILQLIPLTQSLTDADDVFPGADDRNDHRNEVYGQDGDDVIMGGLGEDILIGGKGNDILTPNAVTINAEGDVVAVEPSLQADTYIYNRDDGKDTIYSNNAFEFPRGLLVFTDSNALGQLQLIRDGTDLIFYFNDENSVTIDRWFSGRRYRIRNVQFADNEPVDANTLVNDLGFSVSNMIIDGTSGDDLLDGTPEDDILRGGEGADIITGGRGDDILTPNTLDVVNGNITNVVESRAKDTYVYDSNNGNDIIYSNVSNLGNRGLLQLGARIDEADFTLIRENNDLIFYLDPDNSITIARWFEAGRYRLGELEFFGQTPVDASQWVSDRPLTLLAPGELNGTTVSNILLGTDGDDTVRGLYSADEIEGGLGDDILAGNDVTIDGGGNVSDLDADNSADVFYYQLGDGNDIIYEYEDTEAARGLLQLGTGISADETLAAQAGMDLILTFSDGGTITVYNWFARDNYKLGQIQFEGEAAQSAEDFVNTKLGG